MSNPPRTEEKGLIFKILPALLWEEAQRTGVFRGAPVDRADGFIHFSSGAQVRETAQKHFSGQSDLVLVAVDPVRLGDALRWEASRGGDLFPHLYGTLDPQHVLWARPLPLRADGAHDFSGLLP